MSDEIHDDYPPRDPAEWSERPPDQSRRSRAAGADAGLPARSPRRRGSGRTYVAIFVLLAILIGGAYVAYVNDWVDLGGVTSLVARTGGPAARSADIGKPVFAGNAHDLASPAGNLVQQDKADASVAWIRSSLRQADASGATEGASVQIKPELAGNLVGKHIRLTISARAPDQGTPSPFAVAYSTANVGSSGWVVFTPTKEFDDYSFDFTVPATVGSAQYVGIWSDISGRGAPLAVRVITVTALN